MKRIFIIILVSLAMMWGPVLAATPPGLTDSDDPKPVTYEVRLTIKYNAVTEQEAADIAKAALAAHGQGACQVDVNIKKNGGNYITATLDGTGTIVTREGWLTLGPNTNR
uniref:Uncharacterized protein n=1 Tax=viral metagenome TaxID=1070528 RepID=A0A6H1ZEK4_9ZZZZ